MRIYQILARESDVITAAIDSLDVQVPWSTAKLTGVAKSDEAKVDALIDALGSHRGGALSDALAAFTHEVFCFGNVAVFVNKNGAVVSWPPTWSTDPKYAEGAKAHGTVVEVHRGPVGPDGYGTPYLHDGLRKAIAYLQQQHRHMKALEAFVANPVGPVPLGAEADRAAMNAVFEAIGFDRWNGGDLRVQNFLSFRRARFS